MTGTDKCQELFNAYSQMLSKLPEQKHQLRNVKFLSKAYDVETTKAHFAK
jgi:hypothetical protein